MKVGGDKFERLLSTPQDRVARWCSGHVRRDTFPVAIASDPNAARPEQGVGVEAALSRPPSRW